MLEWLRLNGGTLVVCLILAGIVALIIAYLVRNRKKGGSSCGGCAGCPMAGSCASAQKTCRGENGTEQRKGDQEDTHAGSNGR